MQYTKPKPLPDNPGKLEILFTDHCDQVFRTAYRVTGSVVDAEDVLQTVFLRLADRKEPIDLSPSPGAYLHRAAINASLDFLRARDRSKIIPIEDRTLELADRAEANPEVQQADRELRTRMRRWISRLGPKASEAVVLKYFEGYGNREIAKMLGTSHMVVGVILHRARQQLRKQIGTFLEGHHESR